MFPFDDVIMTRSYEPSLEVFAMKIVQYCDFLGRHAGRSHARALLAVTAARGISGGTIYHRNARTNSRY